ESKWGSSAPGDGMLHALAPARPASTGSKRHRARSSVLVRRRASPTKSPTNGLSCTSRLLSEVKHTLRVRMKHLTWHYRHFNEVLPNTLRKGGLCQPDLPTWQDRRV